MQIVEAKFKNYNRFYVSGIKELIYRPRHKIQIILGQNGSGKSSLLKELIPNVDNAKQEYDRDGYKYLKIKHKNDIIELSYYRNDNIHSFKVNGKEINQSGLMSTQKQLISDYFGLDKHKLELLLSTTTFTNMSISERRKWFIEILSDIDYDYILSVYDKSKQRIKDLTAYIKLTRSKIIKDKELLDKLDNKQIDTLSKRIKEYYNLIEILISKKEKYEDIDLDKVFYKLEEIVESSEKMFNQLSTCDIPDNIDYEITKLTTAIEYKTKEKDELNKKLKKIDELKLNPQEDKEYLKSQINELNTKIHEIESKVDDVLLGITDDEIVVIERNIHTLIELVLELLHTDIPDNKRPVIIKDKLEQLNNEYNLYKDKLLKYRTEQELIDKQRIQLKETLNINVTCPKCHHEFNPTMDTNLLSKLDKEYEKLIKEIANIENITNKINTELTKYQQYLSTLEDFKNRVLSLSHTLYSYLDKHTSHFTNLDNLYQLLSNITTQLTLVEDYKRYKKQLEELHNRLLVLDKFDNSKLNKLISTINNITERYHKVLEELEKDKANLSKLKTLKSKYDTFKKYYKQIERVLLKLPELRENELNKVKNQYYNMLIQEIKKSITDMEEQLYVVRNIKDKLDMYDKELKNYEARLKAVKKINEWLSPNKGLIGETLVNTINGILEDINRVIEEIWSYPMEILPIDLDTSTLDFKFSVKINNSKVIPDISKGSSSIREVIDLAFKIIAMERMDMLDYPLILDEFGRTMDPIHRVKAYDFIEKISKEYFSQIFMVSHFVDMYARFVNADVVVLNNENVNYTGRYNEVVEIK